MDLLKLVENFKNNFEYMKNGKNKYNEHSTRVEYIDPFFELLGWDVNNKAGKQPSLRDVIPERYSTATHRPDYTFSVNGVSKFFLEAKKPSVNIQNDMDVIFQTRSYGWSKNHYISLLTNFEYLLIYDSTITPLVSDNNKTGLLRVYHYEEYIEKWDEIYELLSYEAIKSGSIENSFSHLIEQATSYSIDEHFLKLINNWRLKVAHDLFINDADLNSEYLNEVVQRFINQMIFLRMCEDKNLPIYHELSKVLENDSDIKNEILNILEEADKKYNSGLFRESEILNQISDQTLSDIIKSLYYPISPYAFSVLEPGILGDIYELFLAEKLQVKENEIVLVKKDPSLDRDIVSTPYEIVKIMVEKALKPYCKDKSIDEIFDLRIADIACGSGIFLIEAYDYLMREVHNWYLKNDTTHLIESATGELVLPIEIKAVILTKCIYGLDIDSNAVEVAKFSLLLKLLEDETVYSLENRKEVLPILDNNIKSGNALIDSEMYGMDNHFENRLRIYPFDWNFNNNVNSFDVIIGNPPYVTTEDMKQQLLSDEFNAYKKYYKSAYKQFDKYFLFIERAIDKLKSRGTLVYIIPNKFTKIQSGSNLRRLLTINQYVKEFIDFGSLQLFRNKSNRTKKITTYSSILLLKKEKQNEFKYEKIKDKRVWINNYYESSTANEVIMPSTMLDDEPWKLAGGKEQQELFNKIYINSQPLNNIADTFNGIQTSAERPYPVYWFEESEIINESPTHYTINRNSSTYQIEKKILKPFFKPTKKVEKSLGSYDAISTDKWIIFPYDNNGKIYPIKVMEEEYKGTWEYLKSNYSKLLPRQIDGKGTRDVPHATKDSWFHYGRIQALTKFINKPKLIVGILSKKPLYFLDKNDMLIASGGTAGYCAISQKVDSEYELEFLQAVLSHPVIEWVISVIGSEFENDFYARGTAVLERLPIVSIDFSNNEHKVKYNKIVQISRDIYEINDKMKAKIDKKTKTILENDKTQKIIEIQSIVSELYGIEGWEDILKEG